MEQITKVDLTSDWCNGFILYDASWQTDAKIRCSFWSNYCISPSDDGADDDADQDGAANTAFVQSGNDNNADAGNDGWQCEVVQGNEGGFICSNNAAVDEP